MRIFIATAYMLIFSIACESHSEDSSQLVLTDLNTGDKVMIDSSAEEIFVMNLQSDDIIVLPNSIRLPTSDTEFTDALSLTGVSLEEVFQADYSVLDTVSYKSIDLNMDISERANSSCSGYGCDGVDPVEAGCDGGWAITIASNSQGIWPFSIKVDQRYSRICSTRWSRFTAPINYRSTATIHRDSPSATKSFTHNGTLNYSDMLYCPQNQCWGKASISVPGTSLETAWIKYW